MRNINNDRVMMALAMTMSDKPMATNMSFQREYAERYECKNKHNVYKSRAREQKE